MISAYDDDGAFFRRNLFYAFEKQFFGFGGRSVRVVNVTRDENEIDRLPFADFGDFAEHFALFVDPRFSVEFFPDMPIGRVQYLHFFLRRSGKRIRRAFAISDFFDKTCKSTCFFIYYILVYFKK